MADLKLGSQIGGNLIWHQGILELNPVDDKLNYRDQEVLTDTGNQTLKGTMKFSVPANQYDIESISNLPTGTKGYLRRFRGGSSDTIWHETAQRGIYRLSTGTTDSTLVMELTNSAATFQSPVLTNSPQSGAVNSFARKDYVDDLVKSQSDKTDTKVNKAGDAMTGSLHLNAASKQLTFLNNNNYISSTADTIYLAARNPNGKVVIEGLDNPLARVNGVNHEFYHKGNRPTPEEINAYTKDEIDQRHWIRIKDERNEMIQPNALLTRSISGYFTNKSDVSTSWVSGFTVNGWESSYAAWSLFAGSRSDVEDKRLWFKYGRTTWSPSYRIYHENDKPTNDELNLVSRGGDVMTGILDMKVPNSLGYGNYSIKMNNGSIGGLNQLVFNDPSDTMSEGIMFPKTGKNDQATTAADYDTIWALDGVLKFNGQAAYGEWNKPTAYDTESFPEIRSVLNVDLDTVTTIGSYYQSANANATVALHYPITLAGSLMVSRSAFGVHQEYTTYTGRKFQRGRTNSTTWGNWTEFYSDAAPTRYVKATGDTITGTLKSTANIVIESTYDGMLTLNSTDDGPNYMTFARNGDNRFFIRQSTTGDIATDRLELLSGVKNDSGSYLTPMWVDSTGVYTNLPQKDATNALTRKDYVDQKVGTAVQSVTATGAVKSTGGINPVISLTNATTSADGAMSAADKAKLNGLPSAAVNKTGDSMTGVLVATQIKASTDYGFVRSTDNSQGMFVGADKRTIIGGGADTGYVVIRPNGIGNVTAEVTINANGITAKDFIQNSAQSPNAAASTRKDYVDSEILNLRNSVYSKSVTDGKYVDKSGDTMTGNLNVKTEIFVKDNVNVTGHLIVFADKATGKTAGDTGITTARMIEMLTAMGAFKTVYWCGKVNWDYNGNNVLTDTGYGNIHLAGCIVEVIGTAQYMIRITTPTTTGTALPNAPINTNRQFIYVNHGSAYSPGWRRQLNDHEVNFAQTGSWAGTIGKIPYIGANGVMEVAKYIDFHDTNSTADYTVRLETQGDSLWVRTQHGGIQIGAQNTTFAHLYTDRPTFYMNKELQINGARVMYEGSVHGTLSLSNWIRTTGNTGLFCATHGGGIHMTDTTWVRVYNGKKFFVENTGTDAIYTTGGVRANNGIYDGTNRVYSAANPPPVANVTEVGNAMANMSTTAVGALGFMVLNTAVGNKTAGYEVAGSALRWCSAEGNNISSNSPPGTWRLLGYIDGSGGFSRWNASLWQRIR